MTVSPGRVFARFGHSHTLFCPKNELGFCRASVQKTPLRGAGKPVNIDDSQYHSLLPYSCYQGRKQCNFLEAVSYGRELNFYLLFGCFGLVMG
jgi:hypothetical protein